MNEYIYKLMGKIGILNLILGMSTIIFGIASGVLLIISGIKLIKEKYQLTI